MIKTFKETIASLKDKNYGSVIIQKTLGQAIWYWTQYFLLITIVTVFLIIAGITYFVPQLPKLLQPFPESFSIQDGRFTSSIAQPAFFGTSDLPIIIDTTATDSSALAKYPLGILIMSDKFVVKQEDTSLQTQSISDLPDFTFTKTSVVSWVSHNKLLLWIGLSLGTIVVSALVSLLLWSGRMFGFIIWAFLFWLISKILKYQITYFECAKIVLYASVVPLLISTLLPFDRNSLLSFANLAVFLYFGLTWLITLSKSSKEVPVVTQIIPPKTKKISSKKTKK